ncbi:MAG: acyl-CoA dehydrogenase family protein [Solirubrobacteraceae bacterium]
MLEYPIARAFANARVTHIYGGANEIMMEIVGRSLGLERRPQGTGKMNGSRTDSIAYPAQPQRCVSWHHVELQHQDRCPAQRGVPRGRSRPHQVEAATSVPAQLGVKGAAPS